MAEQVTLPVPTTKTRTRWKLEALVLNIARQRIEVLLTDDNGEYLTAAYPTPAPEGSSQPTGATLLTTLNTANLTTNSLIKRVFTRLITDGYITGSVTGTPE